MNKQPDFRTIVVREVAPTWFRADYLLPVTSHRTFAAAYRAGEVKPEFTPFGTGPTVIAAMHDLTGRLLEQESVELSKVGKP